MAQNFIERLKHSPVLCDGAMGTLLYAKGIFINRCYDELNVSQPELIRGVHHDYLQAGAEIVETNTFGANSFRLARHSLADRVRDINVAGKTSFEEARTAFREQVAALIEGGVDLLMLETFGYLEELRQAVLACRDVNAKIPIVAQVTIDEDGNCLDGSNPETFAARLTEWNVDVLGINCSVGPVAMLDVIERVRAATSLPLAAQPNAGMPRSVEGRNIYLCSPEYMASYTRKYRGYGGDSFRRCAVASGEHSDSEALPAGRKACGRGICDHG